MRGTLNAGAETIHMCIKESEDAFQNLEDASDVFFTAVVTHYVLSTSTFYHVLCRRNPNI